MKKKTGLALLLMGLMLNAVGTSIYAYSEVKVENEFTTGIVDIELEEYMFKDGKLCLWENPNHYILPGESVSKIPRIYNFGNDCYIRADIQFMNTPITELSLYGMSENWIWASDGYYYYKNILPSGEIVDLFEGFNVPDNLDEATQETEFNINVLVEAVQSENFTPDFELYNPWGFIEIQECRKEGTYDVALFKQANHLDFEINYMEDARKLLTNHQDFFSNFPVLLPGDTYTDSIDFHNLSHDTVNLYFRSDTKEGSDLLDQVQIKISKSFNGINTVIYEGNVRTSSLNENLLLATVPASGMGTLNYEIYVPGTLDNKYTLRADSVIWIFSTNPIEVSESVPTGDISMATWMQCIFAGSTLLIVGLGMLMYEKVGNRHDK